eukprot:scaffold58643_cov26-Attheya_sp.AAC.1
MAGVGLLSLAGCTVYEMIVVLWSIKLSHLGLIGWLLLPFPIFSWFRQWYSPDPSPEEPRWMRRSRDAFAHKNRPRYRSPSSRDYDLRRQYPFRLRKENQFVTQPPTLHEQN